MKRIQRGPVRGISLKLQVRACHSGRARRSSVSGLQEAEKERRMDFVPDRSVLDQDRIEVDADTAVRWRLQQRPRRQGGGVFG
jgi:small subunit ribosomal protein S17e